MAVFLSLVTALLYGSGDFLGGLTSRRNSQIQVLTTISLVGVVPLWVLAPLVANTVTQRFISQYRCRTLWNSGPGSSVSRLVSWTDVRLCSFDCNSLRCLSSHVGFSAAAINKFFEHG